MVSEAQWQSYVTTGHWQPTVTVQTPGEVKSVTVVDLPTQQQKQSSVSTFKTTPDVASAKMQVYQAYGGGQQGVEQARLVNQQNQQQRLADALAYKQLQEQRGVERKPIYASDWPGALEQSREQDIQYVMASQGINREAAIQLIGGTQTYSTGKYVSPLGARASEARLRAEATKSSEEGKPLTVSFLENVPYQLPISTTISGEYTIKPEYAAGIAERKLTSWTGTGAKTVTDITFLPELWGEQQAAKLSAEQQVKQQVGFSTRFALDIVSPDFSKAHLAALKSGTVMMPEGKALPKIIQPTPYSFKLEYPVKVPKGATALEAVGLAEESARRAKGTLMLAQLKAQQTGTLEYKFTYIKPVEKYPNFKKIMDASTKGFQTYFEPYKYLTQPLAGLGKTIAEYKGTKYDVLKSNAFYRQMVAGTLETPEYYRSELIPTIGGYALGSVRTMGRATGLSLFGRAAESKKLLTEYAGYTIESAQRADVIMTAALLGVQVVAPELSGVSRAFAMNIPKTIIAGSLLTQPRETMKVGSPFLAYGAYKELAFQRTALPKETLSLERSIKHFEPFGKQTGIFYENVRLLRTPIIQETNVPYEVEFYKRVKEGKIKTTPTVKYGNVPVLTAESSDLIGSLGYKSRTPYVPPSYKSILNKIKQTDIRTQVKVSSKTSQIQLQKTLTKTTETPKSNLLATIQPYKEIDITREAKTQEQSMVEWLNVYKYKTKTASVSQDMEYEYIRQENIPKQIQTQRPKMEKLLQLSIINQKTTLIPKIQNLVSQRQMTIETIRPISTTSIKSLMGTQTKSSLKDVLIPFSSTIPITGIITKLKQTSITQPRTIPKTIPKFGIPDVVIPRPKYGWSLNFGDSFGKRLPSTFKLQKRSDYRIRVPSVYAKAFKITAPKALKREELGIFVRPILTGKQKRRKK